MKQIQFHTTRRYNTGQTSPDAWFTVEINQPTRQPSALGVRQMKASGSLGTVKRAFITPLFVLWSLIAFPFRLVFWAVAWMGRLTAVVLGFLLMVVGIALLAGPFFFLGIPLFLVGLVFTLRSLD